MLRNKEYRQFAVCFLVIGGVSGTAGFLIGGRAGVLAVLSASAFGILFYVFTRARYQSIAEISE